MLYNVAQMPSVKTGPVLECLFTDYTYLIKLEAIPATSGGTIQHYVGLVLLLL